MAILWQCDSSHYIAYLYPQNDYVLITNDNTSYVYVEKSKETYLNSIRIEKSGSVKFEYIINYQYFIKWSNNYPVTIKLPDDLKGTLSIINYLGKQGYIRF